MPQLDAPIILLCSERSGSNMIAKIFYDKVRRWIPDARPDMERVRWTAT